MEILLNKFKSKQSTNVNNFLATKLISGKKLLPQSSLFETINEIEVYNQEREACNLIRLNCVINPICSNILFNSISEIVKNEGDPNSVKLLNYGLTDGFINRKDFDKKIYCKNPIVFMDGKTKEGIRDTQISSEKCGFKYNCGIDIFNNHILRNNTFKTVCYNYSTQLISNDNMKIDPSSVFNTINDFMRDENGEYIEGFGYGSKKLTVQHLYTTEDVESFDDTIDKKLFEKNGWFGFTNIGKFAVVDNNNEPMDIFRVINYRRSCDFIQMYPTSDLWSFTPKYNSYLNRLEKNWNYCLTYPSSSTTQNISFIREKTNSLKIMYIDDRTKLKSGIKSFKIYSICKHGLMKGDFINLYQNDEIILQHCEVREIEDEYIFHIFNPSMKLFNYYYELTKADTDTNGVDDFLVKRPIELAEYHLEYDGIDLNHNQKSFSATTSSITKSNISFNVNEKWKTIKYHGKEYDVIIEGLTRNLNFDPYASGSTYVKSGDILYDLSVTQIEDDKYTYEISNMRVNMEMTYQISNDRTIVYCGHGDDRKTYYLINNNFVNIDDNAQDFSFKKVVDNEEVDYYVRIFSRLPNWKGCDVKIDKQQLYGTNKHLIAQYQTLEHDFENHISQLAFAKNVYGDDISQIVFSDDIDISYLNDNLGRPLTSIYLTLLKNNKGYKEWYGKNGSKIEIRKKKTDNDEDYHIEYSHCFGMLNCAFRLSKESLPNIEHNNSMQLNNIDSSFQYQGLDVEDIQYSNIVYEKILNNNNIIDQERDDEATQNRSYRARFKDILNDEIQYGYCTNNSNEKYLGDTHFYGDLCAYSKKRLIEEPIQQVEMRFNTAQREISSLDTSHKYFKDFSYDEIIYDDKDQNGFVSNENNAFNAHQHKEGYCYYPHYEIPLKTFSKHISFQSPIAMTLTKIDVISNEKERKIYFKIRTLNPHNLQNYDTVYMKYDTYDIKTNKVYLSNYYICYVTDIINKNVFECEIYDEKNVRINSLNTIDTLSYKLFKKDSTTPDYAKFAKDGSCRFIWREIINNGFDNNSDIENYPFFNGAFYVNKQINLFVRRQDPHEYTKLQNNTFLSDIVSNPIKFENNDNYSTESDISC